MRIEMEIETDEGMTDRAKGNEIGILRREIMTEEKDDGSVRTENADKITRRVRLKVGVLIVD